MPRSTCDRTGRASFAFPNADVLHDAWGPIFRLDLLGDLILYSHGRVDEDVDEPRVADRHADALLPPVGEEERHGNSEPVQRPILQAEQQRRAQGVDAEDAVEEHQVEAELDEVADHHVDVPLTGRHTPLEALGALELDGLGLTALADELEQPLPSDGDEDRVLLQDEQELGEDRERDGIDHGELRLLSAVETVRSKVKKVDENDEERK